jgi:hypothetical protein
MASQLDVVEWMVAEFGRRVDSDDRRPSRAGSIGLTIDARAVSRYCQEVSRDRRIAMSKYCVNSEPQPTGEHEVHNLDAGCPTLPAPEHRIALGEHPNCQSAVAAAAARLWPEEVDGCFHCALPCHTK